jgi:hypothetical protein
MAVRVNEKETSGEELQNVYSKAVETLSVEDLKDLLSILYCDPQIVISQIDTDESLLADKRESFRKRWTALFILEQDRYKSLRTMLNERFDVFSVHKVSNPFYELDTFPKAPLLIGVIEAQISLFETGKSLPDDLKIKKIECFTSQTSENDYQIVINGDYLHPLKVSKNIGTWRIFFNLVEDSQLPESKEAKQLYDYLNFNPNNRITTNTKYPRQEVIEQKDKGYVPLFQTGIFTEKALVQRQKKEESSLKTT